jgi:hypothetical protein
MRAARDYRWEKCRLRRTLVRAFGTLRCVRQVIKFYCSINTWIQSLAAFHGTRACLKVHVVYWRAPNHTTFHSERSAYRSVCVHERREGRRRVVAIDRTCVPAPLRMLLAGFRVRHGLVGTRVNLSDTVLDLPSTMVSCLRSQPKYLSRYSSPHCPVLTLLLLCARAVNDIALAADSQEEGRHHSVITLLSVRVVLLLLESK